MTYLNILSDAEQQYAFEQLKLTFLERNIPITQSNFSPINLAELIKKVGKGWSSRYLAGIIFLPSDSRYSNQMNGRDVKRWAAEVLGELDEAKSDWAN